MKIIYRWLIAITFFVLLLGGTYYSFDRETHALDQNQRDKLGVDYASLSHGATHYHLHGNPDDATVVLVHGFSIPSYVWDRNIETIVAAGYRVLSFDLYGRGYSERPEVDYTLDLFVTQLEELTHKLAITKPFHLVGLSMGGAITARYAGRFPYHLKSLTLLAPLVATPDSIQLSLVKQPILGEYLAGVVLMPKISNGLPNTVFDVASYPEWHENMDKHIHFKGYRRALLSTLRNLAGQTQLEDYRRLGQTGIPTLLIWGKEDPVADFAQSKTLLSVAPEMQLHAFNNTGHLPQIEQSEQVNALLTDHFIKAAKQHKLKP